MADLLANAPYQRGETLALSNGLQVEFVRNVPASADAIVRYAGATQVVSQVSLSRPTD